MSGSGRSGGYKQYLACDVNAASTKTLKKRLRLALNDKSRPSNPPGLPESKKETEKAIIDQWEATTVCPYPSKNTSQDMQTFAAADDGANSPPSVKTADTHLPEGNKERLDYSTHTTAGEGHGSKFHDKYGKHKGSPLYEGALLTDSECDLLLLAFILRHRLTQTCIDDLLQLIGLLLPQSRLPTSAKAFRRRVGINYDEATVQYYCSSCKSFLGSKRAQCSICDRSKSLNAVSCYINFNLSAAISRLLSNKEVANSVMKTIDERDRVNSAFVQIHSGANYKKLALGPHDLTLTAFLDGVPLNKSSSLTLYPLFVSLNECSLSLRRKFTICAGLWAGYSSKPDHDIFLSSFVNSCNDDLMGSGVSWNYNGLQIISKVYVPIVAMDSVARCAVMSIHQFNGRYGCPFCLEEGKTVWKDKEKNSRSHKWVYPPIAIQDLLPRTLENFLDHLSTFRNLLNDPSTDWGTGNDRSYMGITGASPFLLLKNLNLIEGMIFDLMHTAYIGVSKKLATAWLSTSNSSDEFYIGNKKKEIDSKFLRCLVPYSTQRVPRSLGDIKHWKAHEWKTWTSVVPIILKGILPDKYLKHYTIYVNAILRLSSETLVASVIDEIEKDLFEFVRDTENLYTINYCIPNLHLLLHAPSCVRRWGPLHFYATWIYEHHNGVLLECFNGNQYIPEQISKKVLDIAAARNVDDSAFANPSAAKYYFSLVDHKRSWVKPPVKVGNISLIGCGTKGVLLEDEQIPPQALHGVNFVSYERAMLHNKKYDVFSTRTKTRCNSIVKTSDNNFYIIRSFVLCHYPHQSDVKVLFTGSNLETNPTEGYYFGHKVVSVSPICELLDANTIMNCKFFCICDSHTDKPSYLVELPNVVELE